MLCQFEYGHNIVYTTSFWRNRGEKKKENKYEMAMFTTNYETDQPFLSISTRNSGVLWCPKQMHMITLSTKTLAMLSPQNNCISDHKLV